MKKLIILITVFTALNTTAQTTDVLFLGNSYTYANDLPLLLKNVALSFGDTIATDQYTPSGYQLIQHSTDATTQSKIGSKNWDYVILQEQSQKPSFSPGQVATDVYPYAYQLNNTIKANYPCTETVFYMTWGRKNGDAANCPFYTPACTYEGMQQRLRESYMEMADSNNATVSPVGVAWKTVRDSFPLIELYIPDESHPSIHGSYLAACVFYATLYQKSPIGSAYIPATINANDALNLQTVASYTVLDSLSLWNVNTNKPTASFNFTGNSTVNFTNTSTNGSTYFWNFGDGNTSTLQDPTNTYVGNGNYVIELTTFSNDSCFLDITTQNININSLGVNNISNSESIRILPNPANNYIDIQTQLEYNSVVISDITGKKIKTIRHNGRIDLSELNGGIYFVQVFNDTKRIESFKLVKK